MIVAGIAGGGGSGGDPGTVARDNADAPQDQSEPDQASLNQAARDGKFEFVVKNIECGQRQIGSADFGTTAQGRFCFVSMSVRNIGDEPQSLFGDNQYLFDANGKKYSADTEAAIWADEANSIYEEINPGNQLEGVVIFDIPQDVQPVKIELHDSAFSNGVAVRLA